MLLSSLLSHVHLRKATPLADETRSQPQKAASQASSSVIHRAAASGTPASGGAAASASSGAITANDFLTLLVTEIQNQDPTSQTDPMQYITQLVGVNSLQQLLQINQTLSTATGPGGALSAGINSAPGAASKAAGVSTANSPANNSAVATAALPGAQAIAGAAAQASVNQLPLAANGRQATGASTNAVAQALTHSAVMPQQVAPPTQVPLNPEVLRALEHSIPGAKLVGRPSGPR